MATNKLLTTLMTGLTLLLLLLGLARLLVVGQVAQENELELAVVALVSLEVLGNVDPPNVGLQLGLLVELLLAEDAAGAGATSSNTSILELEGVDRKWGVAQVDSVL